MSKTSEDLPLPETPVTTTSWPVGISYMATRYEDRVGSWSGGVYGKNSYPGLAKWALDMFIRWADKDPVSKKEVDRNNAVYKFFCEQR